MLLGPCPPYRGNLERYILDTLHVCVYIKVKQAQLSIFIGGACQQDNSSTVGEDFVVVSTTSWLKHAVKTVQGGKKNSYIKEVAWNKLSVQRKKSIWTAHK